MSDDRKLPPQPLFVQRALLIGAGALLVVVAALFLTRGSGATTTGATPTAPGEIAGVRLFAGLVRTHRDGTFSYPQNPPAGGEHNPRWQNCGTYAQPVAPEAAVHSLEHGAVWIAYRPDLDGGEVQKLKALVKAKAYTLLAPYQYGALDKPIVAVAWGARLEPDGAGDPRLAAFIARYADRADGPEPGAPCSGGLGTPVG